MQHLIAALFAASLVAMICPEPALAQGRVHEVEATGIFAQKAVQSTDTGELSISTGNLVGSTDTVLHVFNLDTGRQIGSDDNSGPGLASRLVIPQLKGLRRLLVIARGKDALSGGIADVKIGDRMYRAVETAGVPVDLPCLSVNDIEVVTAPGGPLDTLVVGLDDSGEMTGYDGDSGVGQNSRLVGARVCTAWVGILPGESRGPVRVYANDRWRDGDGDGLGRNLERALGTCDRLSSSDLGCNATRLLLDRDRDGLEDGIEVLGYQEGTAPPQYLPAWGADPRHKDVFVEVDRHKNVSASNPVEKLVPVRDWYAAGPAADLLNPSGLPGIRLHFDIGVEPTNPDLITLFGDWGGHTPDVARSFKYKAASNTFMIETRRKLFRYALHKSSSGGQADGWRFGYSGGSDSLAHELGHSLGLDHWGDDSWGEANCKPNYPSIMNYAFEHAGLGFSLGKFSEFPINPAHALETIPDDDAELSSQYDRLGEKPYEFEVNSPEGQIDWNRDGLDSETWEPVRAGVTWANKGCHAFDQGRQLLDSSPPKFSATALTRVGERLYAFHVGLDGVLYLQHGLHAGVADGGCFDDSPAGTCMSWSDPEAVPTPVAVTHMDVVTWQDSDIVVAYRTTDGALRRISAATEDDLISGWSRDRGLGGASSVEPELFLLDTEDGVRLTALWAENDGSGTFFRQRSTTTPRWSWDARSWLKTEDGNRVEATASPTVVTIPGAVPIPCGVFPSVDGLVKFLCRNRASGQWEAHNPFKGKAPDAKNRGEKMGLAWHVARAEDGTPVESSTIGSLYLSANRKKDGNLIPEMLVSESFDSESMDLDQLRFKWRAEVGGNWTYVAEPTGVALFEDEVIGGLKGSWIRWEGKISTPRFQFEFLPLADGAFDLELYDGNDFRVMERRLCKKLRSDEFCGGADTSPWGY